MQALCLPHCPGRQPQIESTGSAAGLPACYPTLMGLPQHPRWTLTLVYASSALFSVVLLNVYRAPANSGPSSCRHPAWFLPCSYGPSPRNRSPCLVADALLFRERPTCQQNPATGLHPLQCPSLYSSPAPASGCLPELTRHLPAKSLPLQSVAWWSRHRL